MQIILLIHSLEQNIRCTKNSIQNVQENTTSIQDWYHEDHFDFWLNLLCTNLLNKGIFIDTSVIKFVVIGHLTWMVLLYDNESLKRMLPFSQNNFSIKTFCNHLSESLSLKSMINISIMTTWSNQLIINLISVHELCNKLN